MHAHGFPGLGRPGHGMPALSAQAQADLKTLQNDVKTLQAEVPSSLQDQLKADKATIDQALHSLTPPSSGPASGPRQVRHAPERPDRRAHRPAQGRERPGRQDYPDHHRPPDLSVVAPDRRSHPLRQDPGRPGRGEPGPPGRPSSRTARRCRPARPRPDGSRLLIDAPDRAPGRRSPRSLLPRQTLPFWGGQGHVGQDSRGAGKRDCLTAGTAGRESCWS